MLEVCETLMREHSGLRFQTHLNENRLEIEAVANLFPWASDYLAVYERYGLMGRGAVMAHNVHPTSAQLKRLAASGTAIAHCPSSNAALGSGIFPFRRHIESGVRCALGSDVGGGTGFGMLKEGLQAHLLQRLAAEPLTLDPAQLLYLATRAGAEALEIEDETGDFTPGKSADFVYVRAPGNSPLEAVIHGADGMERILAAIFTLGDSASIGEVRVSGRAVYCAEAHDD
jgi:guanine deaminase